MIKTSTGQVDADSKTPSSLPSSAASESNFVSSSALDSPLTQQPVAKQSSQESAAVTRLDAITGEWTIFAPDRTQRPDEFRGRALTPTKAIDCPFCRGNESETPKPVWVGRDLDLDRLGEEPTDYLIDSDADDWSVRIVPNKYPAVAPHEDSSSPTDAVAVNKKEAAGHGASAVEKGLFQCHPNVGGHEVIIESPRHIQSITELDRSDAALVFVAYRDRIRFWREQSGIRYISVFKNVGPQAGASLSHCHSQLIATSHLPSSISAVARKMSQHQARTGCCLQCDLIRGEIKAKTRIIAKTDSLIAYCPFASRLPMLVRITTVDHQDCFESLPLTVIEELSQLVSRVTTWLQKLHPGASYNHVLNTLPPGLQGSPDAQHWSLDLFPRLTQMAGFEWGSQSMINPILPENAAARYRERAASDDPRKILP